MITINYTAPNKLQNHESHFQIKIFIQRRTYNNLAGSVSISTTPVISSSDHINNETFWLKTVREWVFESFIVAFCCKTKNRNINLVCIFLIHLETSQVFFVSPILFFFFGGCGNHFFFCGFRDHLWSTKLYSQRIMLRCL